MTTTAQADYIRSLRYNLAARAAQTIEGVERAAASCACPECTAVTEERGDAARGIYRASGLHLAEHVATLGADPQADIKRNRDWMTHLWKAYGSAHGLAGADREVVLEGWRNMCTELHRALTVDLDTLTIAEASAIIDLIQ